MSALDNARRSPAAIRALLVAVLGAACADVTEPVNLVVPIEIRAEPDLDTLRLSDSVVLRVWADTLTPLTVRWIVGSVDTAVAESLLYHPQAAGTEFVYAVATFAAGRSGEGTRRFTTRLNAAPAVTIEAVPPDDFTRVPLGVTIALVAVAADADGDPLEIRWFAGDPDSGAANLLAMGDTLRLTVDSVGTYRLVAEALDPTGARALASVESQAYDPLTPYAWRRRLGSYGQLTATGAGLVVGNYGAKGDGSNARCVCPLVAFDASGNSVWELVSGSGAAPIPAGDDEVYFTDDTGTLKRISGSGATEWSLAGAVTGPAVLYDGSLVVPSEVGFNQPRRLRRVSAGGAVLWDVVLDSLARWGGAVVGSDSAIYVVGSGWSGFSSTRLVRFSPDGVEQWRIPIDGVDLPAKAKGLAFADDSTLLTAGATISAVQPDGTIRWTRTPGTRGIVVGTGGVAYYTFTDGQTTTLVAIRTADGGELWSQPVGNGYLAVTPLLVADGGVLAVAGWQVVMLDGTTGAERWRHELAGVVTTSPLLTDSGLLVIADSEGYVEALAAGAGPLNSPWPAEWGSNRRRGRANVP